MRLRWEFDDFAFVMELTFLAARFEIDELLMECGVALAGEARAAEAAAVFKNVRRSNDKSVSYD